MNTRPNLFSGAATLGCFVLVLLFSAFRPAPDPDCFVVDARGFNKNCTDNYSVKMRNICDNEMDIKIAIQRNDGRWDGGMRWGVDPGETFTWWACNSTGRYKYWVRQAGSNVRFPRDEEISD